MPELIKSTIVNNYTIFNNIDLFKFYNFWKFKIYFFFILLKILTVKNNKNFYQEPNNFFWIFKINWKKKTFLMNTFIKQAHIDNVNFFFKKITYKQISIYYNFNVFLNITFLIKNNFNIILKKKNCLTENLIFRKHVSLYYIYLFFYKFLIFNIFLIYSFKFFYINLIQLLIFKNKIKVKYNLSQNYNLRFSGAIDLINFNSFFI